MMCFSCFTIGNGNVSLQLRKAVHIYGDGLSLVWFNYFAFLRSTTPQVSSLTYQFHQLYPHSPWLGDMFPGLCPTAVWTTLGSLCCILWKSCCTEHSSDGARAAFHGWSCFLPCEEGSA